MLCPICKQRETYKKTRTVKVGEWNGTYFKVTGEEERTDEWWTCKLCTKIPTKDYIEYMIKVFSV